MLYLFFDTETNRLPYDFNASYEDTENWCRIVQLAWLVCDENGEEISANSEIIFPVDFKIQKSALDIHGITMKKAKKEGKNLIDVLVDFNIDLEKCDTIIAHNFPFDSNVIAAEFYRKSMTDAINNLFYQTESVCTMTPHRICKFVGLTNYYGYKWPKLSELHWKLFKKGFEGEHDALNDVRATKRCFFELKKRNII